jgi:hypothetical protein
MSGLFHLLQDRQFAMLDGWTMIIGTSPQDLPPHRYMFSYDATDTRIPESLLLSIKESLADAHVYRFDRRPRLALRRIGRRRLRHGITRRRLTRLRRFRR